MGKHSPRPKMGPRRGLGSSVVLPSQISSILKMEGKSEASVVLLQGFMTRILKTSLETPVRAPDIHGCLCSSPGYADLHRGDTSGCFFSGRGKPTSLLSVSDAKEKSPITGCCRKSCHYQEGPSLAQSPAQGS